MVKKTEEKSIKKTRTGKDPAYVQVPLTSEEKSAVRCLSKRLGCSMGAVLARALPLLVKTLESPENENAPELTLSGDSVTVEWKMAALEEFRKGAGIGRAAEAAGVTRHAVAWQMRKDPVFRGLAEEAHGTYVETVEEILFQLALGNGKRKPNVTAVLAILNAKHPEYGLMRKAAADNLMEEFFSVVVDAAELFLSPEDLQRYCQELADRCENISSAVRPGRIKN